MSPGGEAGGTDVAVAAALPGDQQQAGARKQPASFALDTGWSGVSTVVCALRFYRALMGAPLGAQAV